MYNYFYSMRTLVREDDIDLVVNTIKSFMDTNILDVVHKIEYRIDKMVYGGNYIIYVTVKSEKSIQIKLFRSLSIELYNSTKGRLAIHEIAEAHTFDIDLYKYEIINREDGGDISISRLFAQSKGEFIHSLPILLHNDDVYEYIKDDVEKSLVYFESIPKEDKDTIAKYHIQIYMKQRFTKKQRAVITSLEEYCQRLTGDVDIEKEYVNILTNIKSEDRYRLDLKISLPTWFEEELDHKFIEIISTIEPDEIYQDKTYFIRRD